MRGTLLRVRAERQSTGIIPAYAGNTTIFCHTISSHRDHPRVCGEHVGHGAHEGDCEGSSPRMRGTRERNASQACRNGIIPAYAGNTYFSRNPSTDKRDHPRVCGEHPAATNRDDLRCGSSPRMRGTPDLHGKLADHLGIIPAYAGNTVVMVVTVWTPWDHPRVCGEHEIKSKQLYGIEGSSPRMRGTPIACRTRSALAGIIPAYAGNTTSYAATRSKTRDHPRVCGEHLVMLSNFRCTPGSSPRMRGTLHGVPVGGAQFGIIPAYAGNTSLPPAR